jgi:WhiB family redox-sensing transcriptional regulator
MDLSLMLPAGSWSTRAKCRGVDPDLFFPERGESTDPAKAVCMACPVQGPCLEHALTQPEKFGIWGGLSERERRRLRRQRRLATSAVSIASPRTPSRQPVAQPYRVAS